MNSCNTTKSTVFSQKYFEIKNNEVNITSEIKIRQMDAAEAEVARECPPPN